MAEGAISRAMGIGTVLIAVEGELRMDDNGKSSDRKVGSFRPSGGIGLAFLVAVYQRLK